MEKTGFSKTDARVSLWTWVSVPIFLLYAICMYAYPAFRNGWDWEQTQNVWDRWQTLNAGVLAILASFIALNISKYHENKQREWRFIAARAFLPSALSELIGYFKLSAAVLSEAYGCVEKNQYPTQLKAVLPTLPVSYVETFRQCIDQAEPQVGEYLADILVNLQVHHSRLTELHQGLTKPGHMVWTTLTPMSYIYSLGKLYALVGKLFPFARGEEPFDMTDLVWEDYRNESPRVSWRPVGLSHSVVAA
jgi:hypothetical protein